MAGRGTLQRRRHRSAQSTLSTDDPVRTAGTTSGGYYRSRHGVGAAPGAGATARPVPAGSGAASGAASIDRLAATGQRLQDAGADDPGFRAHLGFGVGGSIPTGGGDALGGTVRGGEDVGYADEIVTGAGEAISNSTTPTQNGHGANGLY